MGALGAQRVLFLIWNKDLYSQFSAADLLLAFVYGLRFDISSVCMALALPFLFYFVVAFVSSPPKFLGRWMALLFAAVFLPLQTMNIADVDFINFMGRRFSKESLFLMREVPGKGLEILSTHWKLALIWLLFTLWILFRVFALSRLPKEPRVSFLRKKTGWFSRNFVSLLLLILIVVGARGGFQLKPLGFAHAQMFTVPALNNLALNSIFTFTQTLKRQSAPKQQYFTDREQMLSLLNGAIVADSWWSAEKLAQPQNVVVIILESFSLEHMGWPHGDEGYTPFLDQLAQRGAFFPNAYANGRRSIEGIGAIVGGIPALMAEPFISSQFATNSFYGLGTLVKTKNYHSAFFHGAKNGSMYFDSFMASAGFDDYYGLNEYPHPEHHDGTWGVWDEPFFAWTVDQINKFESEPFVSVLFSLSSHHPYRIPSEYAGKFKKGELDIHEAIQYTDMSLQKFFEKAEQQSWYKDTLFIVTADHTYRSFRKQYDNDIGRYRVPMILFHPSISFADLDTSSVVNHIDILPTVTEFLGISSAHKNYLGQSMFVAGDKVAMNFIDNRYYMAAKDYFIEYALNANMRFFSLDDPHQMHSLPADSERMQLLSDKMKAHIQYFNEGLWDNRLYYPVQ